MANEVPRNEKADLDKINEGITRIQKTERITYVNRRSERSERVTEGNRGGLDRIPITL